MRIAHISDIHVRPLSRHSEYRRVFAELSEKLRVQKPDHIVNTGDTFHCKTTNITGEYINLTREWFEDLADIAPLHVVLGNHDFSIPNPSREDAVSPIINAMKHPRIRLYKNSGVYRFAPGYNFCVYSIYDGEDGWKNVHPVEGDVNIAIYHGPVVGCKTEVNYELDGEFEATDFKDYHVTMLGDIHKTQFLGHREYEFEVDEDELHRYPNHSVVGII